MIRLLACAVLMMGGLGGDPALADRSPAQILDQPGYLVIEAAWDSQGVFVRGRDPSTHRRTLEWPEGRLSLPDTLEPERFARQDLGVPSLAGLAGSGTSGRLALIDGIYPVSESIVLTDGRLELEISAGELEIRGAMIRYRRQVTESAVANDDFKSGLLLLAGMTLLVIVLLRRVRMKTGERSGP